MRNYSSCCSMETELQAWGRDAGILGYLRFPSCLRFLVDRQRRSLAVRRHLVIRGCSLHVGLDSADEQETSKRQSRCLVRGGRAPATMERSPRGSHWAELSGFPDIPLRAPTIVPKPSRLAPRSHPCHSANDSDAQHLHPRLIGDFACISTPHIPRV